ncbi:MAG TPA: AAA family ATPase [Candidatus Nanoarchaeia archaeon]|nr:AAA family ATPase [Candidatus Nanoarchaeia archaeon]
MKNKLILAVVGMAGSGKSEVVKYLVKKLNWPVVYLGAITFTWMKKRKIPINWKNEKEAREQIRRENGGMGAYAKLSLPAIAALLKNNTGVIVESLYSWSEYKILKNKFGDNFKVVAALASPAIRFKRLKTRKNSRPMKNYAEFQTRDYSEIENIEKGGPIVMADYLIVNESTLKDLRKKLNGIKIS